MKLVLAMLIGSIFSGFIYAEDVAHDKNIEKREAFLDGYKRRFGPFFGGPSYPPIIKEIKVPVIQRVPVEEIEVVRPVIQKVPYIVKRRVLGRPEQGGPIGQPPGGGGPNININLDQSQGQQPGGPGMEGGGQMPQNPQMRQQPEGQQPMMQNPQGGQPGMEEMPERQNQ